MKVIKQFDAVPNGGIYPVTYMPGNECPAELEATMLHFANANHSATVATGGSSGAPALSTQGPTVAQFVAAGYLAKNYPPEGYESRSTPEEIAQAIRDQEDEEHEGSQTVAQLRETLTAKGIEFDAKAKKAELLALLPKD